MKVRASVKPFCDKCKVVRRWDGLHVICENSGHNKSRARIWRK